MHRIKQNVILVTLSRFKKLAQLMVLNTLLPVEQINVEIPIEDCQVLNLDSPCSESDEFQPFVRQLPEFSFWYSATKSTVIALCCTFIEFINVPAFWPLLLFVYIVLFCINVRDQIKKMIKYQYTPFTFGKPKYFGSREESTDSSTRTDSIQI